MFSSHFSNLETEGKTLERGEENCPIMMLEGRSSSRNQNHHTRRKNSYLLGIFMGKKRF